MRKIARKLYGAIPFKQPVFEVLRGLPVPEPIYRHLHFRGVMRVPVDGTSFLMASTGSQIENDVFWSGLFGRWEGPSLRLWVAAARQAKVILDVGANSGLYALVAKAVAPQARVFAFEPIERIVHGLAKNVALNRFDIRVVRQALSDRDGTATMLDTGKEIELRATLDPTGAVLAGESSGPVTVPVARLDTLVDDETVPPPDLVKIDVEGHEAAVLRGMRATLETRPQILMEVHSPRAADEVEEIVRPLGYRIHLLGPTGPRRIDRVVAATGLFLCTPEAAARLIP